ncbi:hypothetical protein [Parvibium lacunae]|nr:hypothetical protein [Parvibium lacunae]
MIGLLQQCRRGGMLMFVMGLLVSGCSAVGDDHSSQNQLPQLPLADYDQHKGQELIVKFRTNPANPRDKKLFANLDSAIVAKIYLIRPMAGDNYLYGITVANSDLDGVMAQLAKSPGIEYAVKNGRAWPSK